MCYAGGVPGHQEVAGGGAGNIDGDGEAIHCPEAHRRPPRDGYGCRGLPVKWIGRALALTLLNFAVTVALNSSRHKAIKYCAQTASHQK